MDNVWFFVVAIGPVLLLGAIIYGLLQYRNRQRALDPISDEGTRELRRELDDEDREASQHRV